MRSLKAMKLDGLKFVELFQWLSASFGKVSNSKDGEEIDLTPEEGKNPFMIIGTFTPKIDVQTSLF